MRTTYMGRRIGQKRKAPMDDRERYETARAELDRAAAAMPRMAALIEKALERELAAAPASVRALVPEGAPEDKLSWLLKARKAGLGAKPAAPRDPLRLALYGKDEPPPKARKRKAEGFESIYDNPPPDAA